FRSLKVGKHENRHLQRACYLYGFDAFRFDILEYVESLEDLLTREQYYIDSLRPQYNIAPSAGSSRGIKLTPEHKAKLSAAHTGKKLSPEHVAKLNAANRGRKRSPEARARMSASLLGKYVGRKQSPETIVKRFAPLRGRKRSPEVRARMSA